MTKKAGKASKSKASGASAKKSVASRAKASAAGVKKPAAAKAGAQKAVAKKPAAKVKSSRTSTAATGKTAARTSAAKSLTVKSAKKSPAAAKVVKKTRESRQASGPASSSGSAAAARGGTGMASKATVKSMSGRGKVSDVVLPAGYKPSEDEPFMNDKHRAYFRLRLIEWKDEILRQTRDTLAILHEDSSQHADLADRATSETDRATELRTRDRQRKLIAKIDAALARIEDGSYGFCEDTGEPIGIRRLDARPIATLSVEAQERHERRERVYREE